MSLDKVRAPVLSTSGAAISFSIEANSGVSPYLQLVHQVESAIALGYLSHGDQLPTVKEVVSRIPINPNTVLKAYKELDNRGVVVARPGLGTFIITDAIGVTASAIEKLKSSLQNGWLREARGAGLSNLAIVALLNEVLLEFAQEK